MMKVITAHDQLQIRIKDHNGEIIDTINLATLKDWLTNVSFTKGKPLIIETPCPELPNCNQGKEWHASIILFEDNYFISQNDIALNALTGTLPDLISFYDEIFK
jgi:hypothetical protein